LSGWSALGTAYGISDDGLTIVGAGFRGGVHEAWVAHIPEPTTLTLFLVAICFAARRRAVVRQERTSSLIITLPVLRLRKLSVTAFVGIVLLVSTPAIADGPFFMGLGHIEGYEWGSWAQGISGDGTVVVGSSSTQSEDSMGFRWTLEQGMVPLGFLAGGDTSGAHGVSADGSVIVGWSTSYNTTEEEDREAFRWTVETGMVGLSDLPGSYFRSQAYDVTADGETVVGYGTRSEVVAVRHAVRWVGDGPPEDLGGMPGVIPQMSKSSATAVSADGSVVAGWAWNQDYELEAVVWTEDEGIVGLGSLGGPGSQSLAWDVAVCTESVVVGWNWYQGNDHEAFRWTPATGMVGLGDLPGGLYWSEAHAASADGNIIVGTSSGDPGGAFIWDPDHGMRSLQQLLTSEYGLDLTEWSSLGTAYGISDDGLTIVGTGFHNGLGEAWIAHIPEPAAVLLLLLGSALFMNRPRAA
jgi:probable HAF family extracellular repeat protein